VKQIWSRLLLYWRFPAMKLSRFPCIAARMALAGRNPLRSRFTEAPRLSELMWIASAFVLLDWYSTFLPICRAASPVPSS